jgi:5-(carboxyamino)imidazole ribonucleotide mutase
MGIPVATVAIGNSGNAGLLALRILGASDNEIADKLEAYRLGLEEKVRLMNADLQSVE